MKEYFYRVFLAALVGFAVAAVSAGCGAGFESDASYVSQRVSAERSTSDAPDRRLDQSQNVSLNKPAYASSTERNCVAEKAVDGQMDTRYSSNFTDSQWIYVDLEGYYRISQVVINWESAYGHGYDIELSDDAINWVAVYSESNGNGEQDDIGDLDSVGRYVRINGYQRGTQWGYSIFELEVYGVLEIPLPNYMITVLQNINGRITPSSGTVVEHSDKSYAIMPDIGYFVDEVIVDGQIAGNSRSYTFTDVTSDHAIGATYKKVGDYWSYDGLTLSVQDDFNEYRSDLWWHSWSSFKGNLVFFNGPNNFSYENGAMLIQIREETSDWGRDFTGGEIRSNSIDFTYGRYEVRIKAPPGSGYAASLFTFNSWNPGGTWDEIDIEVEGQYRDRFSTNVWMGGNNLDNRHEYVSKVSTNGNSTEDWNLYSFDWLPSVIIFYINGVEVRRETRHTHPHNGYPPANASPAQLMMNFWITDLGGWFGGHNDGNAYPLTVEYDYFKYYSLN